MSNSAKVGLARVPATPFFFLFDFAMAAWMTLA
jgi:hypothetical protein